MIYISIFLTILFTIFCRNSFQTRKGAIVATLAYALSFLAIGGYFVINKLTGHGVNESVIYHLTANMKGVGLSEFKYLIICTMIYLLLIVISALYIYKKNINTDKNCATLIKKLLAGIFLICAWILNPAVQQSIQLITTVYFPSDNTDIPEEFIIVDKKTYKHHHKNLIYIYLESFERTYLDQNIFPNLTPNLLALENESLSFTDIDQIYGGGWTIAGKVNSQCGIPLITPAHGNSMGNINEFLPGATCIGDILAENGYNLSYIQGGDLEFAGKGDFYSTHGFKTILGNNELKALIDPSLPESAWGYYDDTLYSVLLQEVELLSRIKQPFALFALTVDTHHPKGHTGPACENKQYLDGQNAMLNAIHCADSLIGEFIDQLKQNNLYKDTIIVISSDHLAMPNEATSLLEQGERKNLFIITGDNIQAQFNATKGALIDVAPTVLEAMGFDLKGFGFGRSIMPSTKTQTLSSSKEDINSYLSSHREYAKSLWQLPSIEENILINKNVNTIQLNRREISYPVLMTLNDLLQIESMTFIENSQLDLATSLITLNVNEPFVMIDKCSNVPIPTFEYQPSIEDLCISYGSLGGEINTEILNIDTIYITQKNMIPLFQRNMAEHLDPKNQSLHLDKIRNFISYGHISSTYNVSNTLIPKHLENFEILSVGHYNKPSFIENNQKKLQFTRGINLIGINKNNNIELIQNIDLCSLPKDMNNEEYDLELKIKKLKNLFEIFIISVHDSAICDTTDLSNIFQNTPLSSWEKISFRTPYTAVINKDGEFEEFYDLPEKTMLIQVR